MDPIRIIPEDGHQSIQVDADGVYISSDCGCETTLTREEIEALFHAINDHHLRWVL